MEGRALRLNARVLESFLCSEEHAVVPNSTASYGNIKGWIQVPSKVQVRDSRRQGERKVETD